MPHSDIDQDVTNETSLDTNVFTLPESESIPKINFDKQKVSRFIQEKISLIAQERAGRIADQNKFLENWNDYLHPTRKGPWEDAANLHLPLTMQLCRGIFSKFVQAFFGVYPWFVTVPREKMDRDTVQLKDVFMRWALTNYVNDYEGVFDVVYKWLWEIITKGDAFLKLRWERTIRKFSEGSEDQPEYRVVFDGPVLELCRSEDIYECANYDNIQKMPLFAHRIWMSESDLNLRAKTRYYYSDAVSRVIAHYRDKKAAREKPALDVAGTPTKRSNIDPQASSIQETKDLQEGVSTVDAASNFREIEVFETYLSIDVDGDGIIEEMVFWEEIETGEILRFTFLDKVNKNGKRPYFKGSLIKRPGRAGSIGFVELLYPLNTELDAIHNQKLDFGTLITIPFFFYNPAAGFRGDERRLSPGVGIPLDDVNNGVRFPVFPQNTLFHEREEQILYQYGQDVTAIQGPIAGAAPDPIGAGRTATGITTLLSESGTQLDSLLKPIQLVWSQVLQALDSLMQERLPDGVEYRVLGSNMTSVLDDDGNPVIKTMQTRFEYAGSVDYEIRTNSGNLNRELEFQKATTKAQMLVNPLSIQLGVISPNNLYEIYKEILLKLGDTDPDRFLTAPEKIEKPLTLQEEIGACVQGRMPHIVLNDDHEGKARDLEAFSKSESFLLGLQLKNVAANALDMFQQVIRKHQKLQANIDALQQGGAQQGLGMDNALSARMAGEVQQGQQPINRGAMMEGRPANVPTQTTGE